MTEMPTPPVPADCDLRGMPGFMLDTERLLASELWALSDGQTFKAAVALWCRSWRQVPAASLPDDDSVLRAYTGLSATAWRKVRDLVLRGFVRCSDGRLYHRVLAEDAIRAWGKREAYRDRAAAAAQARWERQRGDATSIPQACVKHPPSIIRNMLADAQGQRQGQGQSNTLTPPPSPGAQPRTREADADAGVNTPTPPGGDGGARHRVSGLRPSTIRDAILGANVVDLVAAYGCNVKGRQSEWKRDTHGMQLGEVATVLHLALSNQRAIREPSGWRDAVAEWRAMPIDERREIGAEVMAELGISSPPKQEGT